jgi:hypothetical protein
MRSSLSRLFPLFLIAAPACTRPLPVRSDPAATASASAAPLAPPETPLASLPPNLRAKAEMAIALCEARTLETTRPGRALRGHAGDAPTPRQVDHREPKGDDGPSPGRAPDELPLM